MKVVISPKNIYYKILQTFIYRGLKEISMNLKLICFIVLPLAQIFIPPAAVIVLFVKFLPEAVGMSFCGYPLKQWREIKSSSLIAIGDLFFIWDWEKLVRWREYFSLES